MGGTFTLHKKEGIEFYTVPAFDKTNLTAHAFSSRSGGVSIEKYNSLNLSITSDDNLENIVENRRRFAAAVGVSPESFVGGYQVHSDAVYTVTVNDKGRGALDRQSVIPATDALMTCERGLTLMTFYADCVPVLFLDPVKKAIAVSHAGWKGTVLKIAAKTVKEMSLNFGTNPQDLLVAIGPSIGPCHYQVDSPVIKSVREAYPGRESQLLLNQENGYAQFNMWEANRVQLLNVKVPNENITLAGLCTYCNQDMLFSHRRGMAGRQAAVIMLK
jgi:YfiH family protein